MRRTNHIRSWSLYEENKMDMLCATPSHNHVSMRQLHLQHQTNQFLNKTTASTCPPAPKTHQVIMSTTHQEINRSLNKTTNVQTPKTGKTFLNVRNLTHLPTHCKKPKGKAVNVVHLLHSIEDHNLLCFRSIIPRLNESRILYNQEVHFESREHSPPGWQPRHEKPSSPPPP